MAPTEPKTEVVPVDEELNARGFDDVNTKIELYRKHFVEVGLEEEALKQFIR